MRDVPIRGDMIRLGQLLKLADVIDSGAEVKALLASDAGAGAGAGAVQVNGEPETRRGRQLHPGDVVEVAGEQLRLVAGDDHRKGTGPAPPAG